MKNSDQDRFNIVMAHLKPIEPSSGFDFEFRRRLAEAVAKKYSETPFESFTRRVAGALEGLKEALLPRTPVMVRAMAAFLFFMSAGFYVYSTQPALPIVMDVGGVVIVHRAGESVARPVTPLQELKEGDVITAQGASQLDINMMNKYTVRVKPGTTFRIAKLALRFGNGTVDIRLADGNMLVDIEKGFKGSKFIITTDAGTARALGTKFSVSSTNNKKQIMNVDVLEGNVEVNSSYRPSKTLIARQTVIVGPGQKTEVTAGDLPEPPQRLIEEEWRKLEELYQIGRKPKVLLLLKNTPDRVKQLLAPCPIYISDEKPRELPVELEDAVMKTREAIDTGDASKHIESIKILEGMVARYPRAKYNPQLLLYIGSYYEYIDHHQDAMRVFREVTKRYPESQFAGMAQCAIGIIYEEKLNDPAMAEGAFKLVLSKYPNSLEAIWVEEKLGIKKVRNMI
ncbi:MAG: FecR domain-containing protein [Candidatus Omnitrophica bacterium]|nr:FecR domain-containing protein [Candidatus Omnitrophota bacterium]